MALRSQYPLAGSRLTIIVIHYYDNLTKLGLTGIEADGEHCLGLFENSIGLVTAFGYEGCSRISRRALDERARFRASLSKKVY